MNWLNAVASLIADQEALDADAAKIDALVMREMALAPSVEALATELAIQAQGLPVALAIREIDAAIESIADTWLRLREAGRDLEKARGALAGVAKAEQRLGEETEHWCTAWRESMPAIGLRPEATEEEAEAALAVWSDVPAQRNKRTTALHRADQMTLTLDIRRTEVAALVDRVASDLAATDHIMAIGVLRDRLAKAREAETAARQITDERERVNTRLEKAERRRLKLHDERESIAALAGVSDPADLEAAANRITARSQCRSELLSFRGQLIEQSDGFSEAEVRAERTALPADTVAARSEAIEHEDCMLVEELGKVRAAIEIAMQQRADLEGGRGADSAAQDEAIAAAGLAELARDYSRIEAACLLVSLAIERYRSRYQDPLIARASQLFAALTGKSFAGLVLDYQDADVLTLVAARGDGRRVPIGGLSEGTCDQLYLALRLAALGEFAGRADPLPFICDDLLVCFDDARAGLALDVLAEAGAGLQVILFTHHGHVVDLAKARLRDRADVIEL